MILYLDSDKRIYAYNKHLSSISEMQEVKKHNAVLFDGDFSFDIGETKNGFSKEFFLNDDNTIRIEYIPEQPLSEQEQIAIDTALTVEYIACLMESNM